MKSFVRCQLYDCVFECAIISDNGQRVLNEIDYFEQNPGTRPGKNIMHSLDKTGTFLQKQLKKKEGKKFRCDCDRDPTGWTVVVKVEGGIVYEYRALFCSQCKAKMTTRAATYVQTNKFKHFSPAHMMLAYTPPLYFI